MYSCRRGGTQRHARPRPFLFGLLKALREAGGAMHGMRRAIGLYESEGWDGVLRGVRRLCALSRRQADGRNDYAAWLAEYDSSRSGYRAPVLASRPLVSIVMPVYNPEPRWLRDAIESVLRQTYEAWELCIADDASTDASIRALLEEYGTRDPRIRVVFRPRNGHISAASNSALDIATGSWVVLLDHDDLLSDDALYWVVAALNEHPQAALIYSDEDKITEQGQRCSPHFKPSWNYELFLCYNVVCHLAAYRRTLLAEVGGFRTGYEGAQDYDLALRCVERLQPAQIVHLPRVLYHWRMHAGSTAIGGQSKPYALPAGARALSDHFRRRGISATPVLQPQGFYLPKFEPSSPAPAVALIIPVSVCQSARLDFLPPLIATTDYRGYRVILAITRMGGTTGAFTPDHMALNQLNRSGQDLPMSFVEGQSGWTTEHLIDHIVSQCREELVAVVDPGILPQSANWLQVLAALATRPGVGAVGVRVADSAGRTAQAGAVVGLHGGIARAFSGLRVHDTGYFHRGAALQAASVVTPGCVVVSREVYGVSGGLAASGLSGAAAVYDWCLRLYRAGKRNIQASHVLVRTSEPSDAGTSSDVGGGVVHLPAAAPELVHERWREFMACDPAYNPNLSLEYEDYSLAWPPRSCSPRSGDDHIEGAVARHATW